VLWFVSHSLHVHLRTNNEKSIDLMHCMLFNFFSDRINNQEPMILFEAAMNASNEQKMALARFKDQAVIERRYVLFRPFLLRFVCSWQRWMPTRLDVNA
jgi:hypothetical protein